MAEELFGGKDFDKTMGELEKAFEDKSAFRKFIDAIKNVLSSIKEALGGSASAEALERNIVKLQKQIDSGKTVKNNNGKTISFSAMNNNSFENNVDDIVNMSEQEALKNKKEANFVKVIDNTPDVILNNVEDAENIPIIIRFDALYLATRENGVLEGHYHNLGEQIKKLPQYISNPDAIVRMKNGRINLFATMQSKKGNNGIISIELNTVKDINSKNDKYNLVISVFTSKDNYVRNLIKKQGAIIEYKKEDLSQVNPQLYEWLAIINDMSSTDNISQNDNVVNSSISENSKNDTKYSVDEESKQTKDVYGFKLNANADVNEDLLEELSIHDKDAKVDRNGDITVYHRTSTENAEKIYNTGKMTAKEDALFFSSQSKGYASDYGDTVVALKIPSTKLLVNDIFDGEVHFEIPLQYKNNGFSLDVSKYLVKENSGVKFKNSVDNTNKTNYNKNEKEFSYERTDEFRKLQAESKRLYDKDIESFHNGSKQCDERIRGRLSRIFERQIKSASSSNRNVSTSIVNPKTGKNISIYENVDYNLFHDVFEIAQKYLFSGDAVDVHEATEYKNCKNYLTSNGLGGFSITADGDLISVYNLGEKGFLKSISNFVRAKGAKTLDCFNSTKQCLPDIYSYTLGFKNAATLDFNYEILAETKGKEYADYFVKNYGEAPVCFMVNTEKDVETKHFNKDQYDEAVDYRNSFVENDIKFSVAGENGVDSNDSNWYNVNRASKSGDLINEFYPALEKSEWKKFYDIIAEKGYLKKTKIGDKIAVAVNDKLVLSERVITGKNSHDFQVYKINKISPENQFILSEIQETLEKDGAYNANEIEKTVDRIIRIYSGNEVFKQFSRNFGGFVNYTAEKTNSRNSRGTFDNYQEKTERRNLSFGNEQNNVDDEAGLNNNSAFLLMMSRKSIVMMN